MRPASPDMIGGPAQAKADDGMAESRPGRNAAVGLASWLRHPFGSAILRDAALCRFLAILPAPLILFQVLHLPGLPCLFHEMTGLPCPGCGMTRAIVALLHGDLAQAFTHHPLGVPVAAIWLLLAVAGLLPTARRLRLADALAVWDRRLALSTLLLAAFLIHGLARLAFAALA